MVADSLSAISCAACAETSVCEFGAAGSPGFFMRLDLGIDSLSHDRGPATSLAKNHELLAGART